MGHHIVTKPKFCAGCLEKIDLSEIYLNHAAGHKTRYYHMEKVCLEAWARAAKADGWSRSKDW